MTDTTKSAATEMLLAMADQEFEKIVISQLHPNQRTTEIHQALLSPAVVLRTKDTLDALRLRTEAILQAKRADLYEFQGRCAEEGPDGKTKWLRGKGEYEASRKKSGYFLKLVATMQIEIKRPMREATARPQLSPEASRRRREKNDIIKELVSALITHERVQQDNCTSQDEVLWDLLDTLTITWNEQERTLREVYESEWS